MKEKAKVDPKDRRIDNLVLANEQKTNEIKRVRRALKETETELQTAQKLLEVVHRVESENRIAPVIEMPKLRTKSNPWSASLVFVTSDWQLGEVVDPKSIRGYNAYDTRIAQMRFRHTAQSVVKMSQGMPTYDFDEIVVVSNGDVISGDLHDLSITNDQNPMEQTLMAISEHEAMIRLFRQKFKKVRLIIIPGNHDRRQSWMQAKFKGETTDTFTYLMGRVLARTFNSDNKVEIQVSDTPSALFQVQNMVFAAEHGHRVKAGSDAWAGIMPALARATMKRSQRDLKMGTPADHYIYSHYHQLTLGPSFTMSGSYVGVNEMSFDLALDPQPPLMPLLVVTPERDITLKLAVDCRAPGEEEFYQTIGRNEWLS